jgi:methionyl-tRNA synthetase
MPGPDQTRYYVTTPIYYVNDAPHIGHAYTTVACDVLARFKRLDGTRVHFLTGTDDHGQKVEKSAQAAGTEPQAFTDQVSGNFRRLAAAMNCTNDDFIRTTETRHKRSCQAIWRKLMDAGEIYLSTYAGWYAVRDEAFYGENELAKQPDGSLLAPSGAPVECSRTAPYSRPRGLRSNGSRSRPISSGCRPGATGCSSFTKRPGCSSFTNRPASSCPKAGATRSSPS